MSKLSETKRQNGNLIYILSITNESNSSKIDYAVKLHWGKWYVYISKDGNKYYRRHGPFTTMPLAEDCIYSIRDEIKDAISKASQTRS